MARKSTSSSVAASNGEHVIPSAAESSAQSATIKAKEIWDKVVESDVDFDDFKPTDRTRGKAMPVDESFHPNGTRSLTAIGEQAFFLGFTLAGSLSYLAWTLTSELPHPLWRSAAFITTLSIFHYLEYETTARYNLPTLRSSSFLLFTNGKEYNIAYVLAMVEVFVSNFFFPVYQNFGVNRYTIGAGIALIVIGQVVRSTAMIQAGTNFNHTPANKKEEGHELVTHGIYGWLRHPSYFGFFWWAIGTQLLVGNKVCLVGYAIVLQSFFDHRITVEEKKLLEFFGKEYEEFRNRTPTGIPFVK